MLTSARSFSNSYLPRACMNSDYASEAIIILKIQLTTKHITKKYHQQFELLSIRASVIEIKRKTFRFDFLKMK